jgi:hypothetical protein
MLGITLANHCYFLPRARARAAAPLSALPPAPRPLHFISLLACTHHTQTRTKQFRHTDTHTRFSCAEKNARRAHTRAKKQVCSHALSLRSATAVAADAPFICVCALSLSFSLSHARSQRSTLKHPFFGARARALRVRTTF